MALDNESTRVEAQIEYQRQVTAAWNEFRLKTQPFVEVREAKVRAASDKYKARLSVASKEG